MLLDWGSTTSYGTYEIPTADEPDYPIGMATGEGGNYVRSYLGGLYNPTSYLYKTYSLSFTGITPATVDAFVYVFTDEAFFGLQSDELGTLDLIPVPGSLSVDYITLGNCNLTFSAEQRIGDEL